VTNVTLVASLVTTRRWYSAFFKEAAAGFELGFEAWDLSSLKRSLETQETGLYLVSSGIGGMNFLEVLVFISKQSELPILAVVNEDDDAPTREELLAAGATSVLEFPRQHTPEHARKWKSELLLSLRASLKVRRISRNKVKRSEEEHPPPPSYLPIPLSGIICIGGSTGAPQVMSAILRELPAVPVPIIVVIHCSGDDGGRLLEWLKQVSRHPVLPATHNLPLSQLNGKVVVATAPDKHVRVSHSSILLSDEPERHFCRPSVDVLFESAASTFGSQAVGVLLTGMGVDGAAGLLKMKKSGASTLVQDRKSAPIFGMPGAAVALGAADFELSEGEIASFLLRRFNDRFART